jgi:hypothetical protein
VKADDLMDKLIEKALEEVRLASRRSFRRRTANGGAADRHRALRYSAEIRGLP